MKTRLGSEGHDDALEPNILRPLREAVKTRLDAAHMDGHVGATNGATNDPSRSLLRSLLPPWVRCSRMVRVGWAIFI